MTDRSHTLAAICDTFVPGDGNALPSASSLGTAHRLRSELEALGRPALIAELDRLLDTVDSPVMNAALTGRPLRFTSLDQAQRAEYLRRWAASPPRLVH